MKKLLILLAIVIFSNGNTIAQDFVGKAASVQKTSENFPLKGSKLMLESNGIILSSVGAQTLSKQVYKSGTQLVRNLKKVTQNRNYTEYSMEVLNKNGQYVKQKGFVLANQPQTMSAVDWECSLTCGSNGCSLSCTVSWDFSWE